MPITKDDARALYDMMKKGMAQLTEEQNAKNAELRKAFMTDENAKKEMMEEMQATFTAADTNNDGLLDLAEFKDFRSKSEANNTARGGFNPTMSEEDIEAAYNIHNSGNPDKDGVALADIFANMGVMMATAKEEGWEMWANQV